MVIRMNAVEYDWVTVLFNMLLWFFGTVCLFYASTCTVIKFKSLLTSSHWRPYKHAIYFGTSDRRVSKCGFRFLCVLAGALSTYHAWRAIVEHDLYTRNHFSESMGSRFGGPGQKALQAMNEFTLLWIFA